MQSAAGCKFYIQQLKMTQKPPFPNDDNFIAQIEGKIEPNRHYPFVQLKSLDEENLNLSATLDSKRNKRERKAATHKLDFKCHLCSKEFIHHLQLTHHLKNDHPEVATPFACSVCSDSYKTSKELNLHLGTEHPDQFKLNKQGDKIYATLKTYQCPQCPTKWSSTTHLNNHIASHTNEKPHICKVCGSKYKTHNELQIHKSNKKCSKALELKSSKKFECDLCETRTKSDTNLRNHKHLVHGIKIKSITKSPLICLFCGYKAPNSYTLQRHNLTHTNENPFECKACNNKFRFKCSMNAHIRSKCPAAKAMGLEPELQKPANNPTSDVRDAEGQFKCRICDQKFKINQSRKKHEESHGDKSMCQFCPAGFKNNMGLKYHEMKMHPSEINKPFSCSGCGKDFSSKTLLRKHEWECFEEISIKVEESSVKVEEDMD